jgi:hypothetical protein
MPIQQTGRNQNIKKVTTLFLAEKLSHVRKVHLHLAGSIQFDQVRVHDDRVVLPDARELQFTDCKLAAPLGAVTQPLLPLVLVRECIDALIEVSEQPLSRELSSRSYQLQQCRQCRQTVCDFSAFVPAAPFALRSLAETSAAAERFSSILFSLGVNIPSGQPIEKTAQQREIDSRTLRVLPLPSDNWQELTDLWVCHAEQTFNAPLTALWRQARGDHVLCPPLNTLYVGATHLLIHPRQFDAQSIRVCVGSTSDELQDEADDFLVTDNGITWIEAPEAIPTQDADQAPGPLSKHAPTTDVWRTVLCSSCRSSLGLMLLAKQSDATPMTALTVKLFKDSIINCSASEPSSSLWNRYSVECRLACQLAAAARAHGRFRFVLRSRARRPANGLLTGSTLSVSAEQAPEMPLCIIVSVLNLDSSIASDALTSGQRVGPLPTLTPDVVSSFVSHL